MDSIIRVCVVAGFEPLRVGLARTIAGVGDMDVIGEASGFADLIANPALREADVFIVDADVMAAAQGSVAARAPLTQLNEWLPALKVIFLGNHEDARLISPDDLPLYMRLNAAGFLMRDGTTARLIQAIRLVAGGTFVCETSVIKRIITRLSHWASYTDEAQTETEVAISARESEVLGMVARGSSNKEIAQELFLSEGTVKSHVSHIMAKLKVDRRADLVRYAFSKGVIPLGDDNGDGAMERHQLVHDGD